MVNRFSLYDFIAVVMPGMFLLWSVKFLVDSPVIQNSIPSSGGLAETSILVVLGYIVGLLIQGISFEITEKLLLRLWGGWPGQRWLNQDDKKFTSCYKEDLYHAILIKFGIKYGESSPTNKTQEELSKLNLEVFFRCYRSIEKLSDTCQVFNAQYGLFRSLLTIFFIVGAISIWKLISFHCLSHELNIEALMFFVLSIIGIPITYLRVTKRGEDFARLVFDLFLVNFWQKKT